MQPSGLLARALAFSPASTHHRPADRIRARPRLRFANARWALLHVRAILRWNSGRRHWHWTSRPGGPSAKAGSEFHSTTSLGSRTTLNELIGTWTLLANTATCDASRRVGAGTCVTRPDLVDLGPRAYGKKSLSAWSQRLCAVTVPSSCVRCEVVCLSNRARTGGGNPQGVGVVWRSRADGGSHRSPRASTQLSDVPQWPPPPVDPPSSS